MTHNRRGRRFSIPGRLTLLFGVSLAAAAGAASLASYLGAPPLWVFLSAMLLGLPTAAFTLSTALGPSLTLLEALSDGVDGWRSGDFSLRLVRQNRSDELGRLVSLYNDMGTMLRRERNELRQRELLLKTIIDTSPAAVILLSERRHVQLANRQAQVFFGDGRSLIGRSWSELDMHSGLQNLLDASADQLVQVEVQGVDETLHVARREFDLNVRRHTLLMVHRVTAELRRQEVAAWKKVLRVIAHELNNSLAPIRSVAKTARGMLALGRPTEQLDEALETIDESAARLHQFIDGYARFARLPAPRLRSLEAIPFIDALRQLEPFRSTPVPENLKFRADPAQLQQALLNLIRNAREAGSTSESIYLNVEDLGPGGIRLVVLDRGKGMDSETLRKALLPFYSTKTDGTGLGLALAREIIDAHGGRLDLALRSGGGLEVACWLPQI
jgi:two-component system nitrogen regulation sensor histidine kinase NtrY